MNNKKMGNASPKTDLTTIEVDGKVTTTSLKIAEFFSKRHGNVLRLIESLKCSDDFRQLNFESANYIDAQGKPRVMYQVTKNGLVMLAGRFNTKESAALLEHYIGAFDNMAAHLAILPHLKNAMDTHVRAEQISAADASDGSRKMNARKKMIRQLAEDGEKIRAAAQCVFEGVGFTAPEAREFIAANEKGG
ncbi:Rha family transcriptional regulator [Aeromonas encheleia]|uniref:Rha family transcriptional regulator n=1 Tax=Aeromonas encheleia TaxID=73010 RepID=UPI001F56DFAA|nr:Rha family transcriptional regulator [Aeromonas encheleia]UNP89646.1 Rha family transcriptional regulator [Aeromonas encheleia]